MIITDPSVRSVASVANEVVNFVVIDCQEPEGLVGITVALIVGTADTGARLVGGLVGLEGD